MFIQKVILEYQEEVQNLFLRKRENEISFDTFFNSLNLYLIKKYTDGKKLTVYLDYEGSGNVKVICETEKNKTVLYESNKLDKKIEIDLSKLDEKSIIFPVFSGNFDIKSIRYEVDSLSRKVLTCVLFTTFNRQDFLIPNLYKLDKCENVEKVIIVDNASNVELPNDLSKDKFKVIPNKNLGGTGGFTRGMIEAKKEGFSHIFIMDDDITLIPAVVDKAISLISNTNKEHKNDWLGFSMLPNNSPMIQYELGTNWNGVRMRLNNRGLDVSNKENLFKNQVVAKYNYSAWWSLLMPTTVIDEYKYPFPFFIKFDDIEYGLRRKGEEIILSNGFAVWHEDFDKKYNPYLEYYLYRNALVTNSLHDKKPLRHSLGRYLAKNIKAYFRLRFVEMKLINLAIDDFNKGPAFFFNLDIEAYNNKIRGLVKNGVNVLKGLFINPFIVCFYAFKLVLTFNKSKKLYMENVSQLTSEEYWRGVFK